MRFSWIIFLTLCSVAIAGSSSQYVTVVAPLTMSTSFVIGCRIATGSLSGCLSAADWTTFNSKQSALTFGNLTSGTTGLSVTGGSGSVIGSGVSLSIQTSSGSQPGLLSAADWATFNSKAPTNAPVFTGKVTTTHVAAPDGNPSGSSLDIDGGNALASGGSGGNINIVSGSGFIGDGSDDGYVNLSSGGYNSFQIDKLGFTLSGLPVILGDSIDLTATNNAQYVSMNVHNSHLQLVDGEADLLRADLYIGGNSFPQSLFFPDNGGIGSNGGSSNPNYVYVNNLSASQPVVSDANKKLVSQSYSTFTSNLSVMQGDGGGGAKGLVPAQVSGDAAKFLRGDGLWATAGGTATWGGITGSSPQIPPVGGFTGADLLINPDGGAGQGINITDDGVGHVRIRNVNNAIDTYLDGGASAHLRLNFLSDPVGGWMIMYALAPLIITHGNIAPGVDNTGCLGCDDVGSETGNRYSKYIAGTYVSTPAIKNLAAQSTLTGSAGTAVCSQPDIGASYKKVLCYLSGYSDTGTQDYTFPTAFAHTPDCRIGNGQTVSCTASTTTVHFTAVTQTGFVFVEGY